MIHRPDLIAHVQQSLQQFPVTLILGPRQCGKTTLARVIYAEAGGTYFDLEDPETPLQPQRAKLVLQDLRDLVVIDEFQRQPELFPLLRVLADRRPLPARFLVLGSASPALVQGVSESLAGRVAYVHMSGFTLEEVGVEQMPQLWIRGGFPEAFLAADDEASYAWRRHFMQTFLERDIPQLGLRIPAHALRRFWTMVAHFHGQVWNAAEFARSLGTKEDTARRYLDILSGAFMVRQLPPWFENIGKRLVKAPKVYLRDSGLLHTLLGVRDHLQVQSHPKLGFSWEGFALEQIIQMANAERDAFFYRTHAGAELDLLLVRNGKRYGFEFKYEDAPKSTKSMHVVSNDLKLVKLWVVYPGGQTSPLREGMEVVPLKNMQTVLRENDLM
jgi:predicted AAA+ superfamily ATPase